MSESLSQAFGKVGILSVEDPLFQDLPSTRDDPLWNDFKNHFSLTPFELGALKNARCEQPAGKYSQLIFILCER